MSRENLTGYPSIDKPWLKYYSEEAINAPLPKCTFYEYVFNRNKDNMDNIAINYYGRDISYRKLFEDISYIAGGFKKIGIKENDVVTICMINSPEAIETIFALNKLGAVANMIYGVSSVEEIEKFLVDTNSTIVVCLDIFQEKFVELSQRIKINKVIVANQAQLISEDEVCLNEKEIPLPEDNHFISWNEFISNAMPYDEIHQNPDTAAIITYTGGSTGGSKGVVLSNRNIVSLVWQHCNMNIPMDRKGKWMLVLPMFIVYGVVCAMAVPLSIGMKLIIRIPMTDSIAYICKKFKPNYVMYGPAYWEAFAENNEDIDLSDLVYPFSGGDFIRPSVEEKINNYLLIHNSRCGIMNGYGMSEVCGGISMNIPTASEFGSVGIPLPKTVVTIFDTETEKELKYGEIGEICVQSPDSMLGYINNPDETKSIIRRHIDGQIWVHSGDLGYINESGFLYIIGRIKRFMLCISEGVQKKVFSLDIEKILLEHKKVANCAVVPIPDDKINEAPVAYIILKEKYKDEDNIEAELFNYCNKKLPHVYRPIRYIFVEKFPLTKVGKVDYIRLEKLASKGE